MWLVPLAIALFGAIFFMNNLTSARSTFKDQVGHRRTQTHLDHVLHLCRDLRLFHRLFGGVPAA